MAENSTQDSGGIMNHSPDSHNKSQDNNVDGNPHNYLTEERFVSTKILNSVCL